MKQQARTGSAVLKKNKKKTIHELFLEHRSFERDFQDFLPNLEGECFSLTTTHRLEGFKK